MPWHITGPPWYVVKTGTGEKKNKTPHPSKAAAKKHLSALYANTKTSEVWSHDK